MYELCKVGESTYYVESPAKVGIYVYPDNTAVLIDSGNDKDAAKKVYKILNEHNWTLRAILNSHSHSDHIGGNAFLQGKTGCRIFASGIDAAVSCHTLLEPTVLYGGCPAKDLKHKFLMASPSRVEDISSPDFPKEIEIIPLPGHSFDLVAYKTPDGVVFISDTISSRVTLEKYGIPYIFDIGDYLRSLDALESMDANFFVPAHAEPAEDIKELVSFNREQVMKIADDILKICETPTIFEELLKRLFDDYALTMTFEQYALVGSCVRSFLSWHRDAGRLEVEFIDNRMLWKTVK